MVEIRMEVLFLIICRCLIEGNEIEMEMKRENVNKKFNIA
jgi:hypothetical protein